MGSLPLSICKSQRNDEKDSEIESQPTNQQGETDKREEPRGQIRPSFDNVDQEVQSSKQRASQIVANPSVSSNPDKPVYKSNLISRMITIGSEMPIQSTDNADLVIPDHVTKMLVIMGSFVMEQKYMKMFDDCKKLPCKLLKDGSVYDGQWSDGIRTGFGKILYADQSYYEGYWINDERHFEGRFIDKVGDGYTGEWFADEMHGKGRFYHADSTSYQINNDIEEKRAKMSTTNESLPQTNGKKYFGDVLDNKKHGFGILQWPDGKEYYGHFKLDKCEGFGVKKLPNGHKYEGQFFNNEMHGLGTYTWPDGHIYIGLFEHNLKEGYGMMVWPNGTKYRGQYHGGKQTGFGRVSISGQCKEYHWENGRRRLADGASSQNLNSPGIGMGNSQIQ